MVPGLSIFGMAFTLAICLGMTIGLLLWLKLKKKAALFPAAVGAVLFTLFALILEMLLHQAVFTLVPAITQNPILYVIYGCLAAGVFEETARLCGLYYLRSQKKCGDVTAGLAYGVGHGGAEAILIVGMSSFNNLILSYAVNTQGTAALMESVAEADRATAQMQLDNLINAPSALYFWAGIERITTMAIQIALSVIIWMVVTKRLKFVFYPVAILLHALIDIPAVLYQLGAADYLVTELAMIGLAVLLVIFVCALYKKHRKAPEESGIMEELEL